MPADKVRVHTLLAGGSFGRRATPDSDVAGEAAAVAKAVGGGKTVKVVWTREDDIRGGRYRPLYVHRLRAGLDARGTIVGWEHRIVGQSIGMGTPFEAALVKDGIDATSVEGAANLPYDIPNLTVELHTTKVGVPVLWWRSVGSTHTAYSTETFLDELAHAAGRDPLELRRALLAKHPRHLAALEPCRREGRAGASRCPPGARAASPCTSPSTASSRRSPRSRGARTGCRGSSGSSARSIAGPRSIPTSCARRWRAGSATAWPRRCGARSRSSRDVSQQRNFDDYRPLRIDDMPAVEVHIVPSGAAPTGVGEPGVPPIAPAVANAFFHLTGQRVRRLPFARLAPAGTRTT